MNILQATRTCFGKYVTFTGRANRPEYWWFLLFGMLGSWVATMIDQTLWPPAVAIQDTVHYGAHGGMARSFSKTVQYGNGVIAELWSLVIFLPGLAVAWRRLHDTGRSGWMILLPMLIGISLLLLALLVVSRIFAGLGPLPNPEDWMTGVHMAMGGGILSAILLAAAALLPMASAILVIFWLASPSQPGANQFGPNPNEVPS